MFETSVCWWILKDKLGTRISVEKEEFIKNTFWIFRLNQDWMSGQNTWFTAEVFSWKTTSHKGQVDVCALSSRLLSALYRTWSWKRWSCGCLSHFIALNSCRILCVSKVSMLLFVRYLLFPWALALFSKHFIKVF